MSVPPPRLILEQTADEAERVYVTQGHDLFAAAILAEAQLRKTEGITHDVFPDVEAQRTWRVAQNTLREAQRAARARAPMAKGLDDYRRRFATYEKLLARLDGAPEAYVGKRREALHRIDTTSPQRIAATAGAAAVVLAIVALAVSGLAIAAALGAACCLILMVVAARSWVARHRARDLARAALHDALARADAYAAYMDDPTGGQWLRTTWERHPLLLSEAPGPAESGVIRVQRASSAA